MSWLPGFEPSQVIEDSHDGAGDSWFTPRLIVDAVASAMGGIDLDPCAHPGSPTWEIVKHRISLSQGGDGLTDEWQGDGGVLAAMVYAYILFMLLPIYNAIESLEKAQIEAARDLGAALGCHGHVLHLRRIWSGPFEAEDGLTYEQIEELARTPELDDHLLPLEQGLADLPEVKTTEQGAAKLRNGNPGLVIATDVEYGDECWASLNGEAVAVGVFKAGELHPSRVFVRG